MKICDLRQVGGFLKYLDENLDVILSNNDVIHNCIDDIVSVEEEGGGWWEWEWRGRWGGGREGRDLFGCNYD